MLVFDQLRKNDPQLQLLTLLVCVGLITLLAGLWWVQVVNARQYQESLETQSYRTVRIPPLRGKIMDAGGEVLAESRATYEACLYFEELRKQFDTAYAQEVSRVRKLRQQQMQAREKQLARRLTKEELRAYVITLGQKTMIRTNAAFSVTSNIVAQIGARMQMPLSLNPTNFFRHYNTRLALPFPVLQNLTPEQIGRFEETCGDIQGAELVLQATRAYPFKTAASHLVGYVVYDDKSVEGEDAYYYYPLKVHRGVVGVEGGKDLELRGKAGTKSVLINNRGFRQGETVWAAAEAGRNVVLTIDMKLQATCEQALRGHVGSDAQGAVVVMDVNTGDVLSLVSLPASDPNYFIKGFPVDELSRWKDEELGLQKNRATREIYQPGSIFKTIVALACLERGLNPNEEYTVEPNPRDPAHGIINVGRDSFKDTVSPGKYNLRRAIARSSNAYFIHYGLRYGIEHVVELGRRLHLGERCQLPTMQDTDGKFPSVRQLGSGWFDGDSANICIGQGRMAVTPMQMTVMTAALANGGKVLWPRLIARYEPQDPASTEPVEVTPSGRVRDELGVKQQSLMTLRSAMLAETEDPEGTGYPAFSAYYRAGGRLRVCGKTGTAQVKDERGRLVDYITWFASFAPYEQPRYAVVVMVESGTSGGGTCAPVAREIYKALEPMVQRPQPVTSNQAADSGVRVVARAPDSGSRNN